ALPLLLALAFDRCANDAFGALRLRDEDEDLIADFEFLELFFGQRRKIPRRDDPFRLRANIDEELVPILARDRAVDDITELGGTEFILWSGEHLLHQYPPGVLNFARVFQCGSISLGIFRRSILIVPPPFSCSNQSH